MSRSTPSPPILLSGGTVLTLDSEAQILSGADLLLVDGRIAALGSVAEVPAGTRRLDVSGNLVLPGLIQGHVHLGQTAFRGLAERRPLLRWLSERIWPLEAGHTEESAYWTGLWGAAECLLGGTTTIQDIGIGPGAKGLLQAIVDSGIRAVAGLCLMDVGDQLPSALAQRTDDALALTVELGEHFDGAGDGRLRYGLNPRFILSCSDALWRGIRDLAEAKGWPVHTHALEQREEGEAVRALKGGRDEIEYFDDEGVLGADLRIAHGVWLTPGHRQRVKSCRFSVVTCPSSNLKLGSGMADLKGIVEDGIPLGIGADGAPCNNDLDVLEEVRLAALMQSVEHGPEHGLSGLEALRLATSEGARALALDDEIGSLEVGKRGDVLVLDRSRPELWAAASVDPHDLVAFSATRAAVRHVLIDGEPRVEEGRLVGVDSRNLELEALGALERLLGRVDL